MMLNAYEIPNNWWLIFYFAVFLHFEAGEVFLLWYDYIYLIRYCFIILLTIEIKICNFYIIENSNYCLGNTTKVGLSDKIDEVQLYIGIIGS